MRRKRASFVILGLFAVVAGSSCANLGKTKTINFASISDGTYTGEAREFVVFARVDVTMKAGAIEALKITKIVTSPIGEPALVLAERVVQEQSLDLDAVSGATLTSNAILGAGRNALSR
jgi:uncharacterized protein with FMN-binding domain